MKYKINLQLFCIIFVLFSVLTKIQAQSNGDIRLTNGDRGILEVYYDGWGFVCDDGWNELNSNVTCSILGYSSAASTVTSYYDSDVDYKLIFIGCSGNETDILECDYDLYSTYSSSYCSSYEHIYITCNPANGEIRLTNGNRGILEVYYDGWGFVCDDGWSEVNANVSCSILGYSSASRSITSYYDSDVNYKLIYIGCIGNEADILNCAYILYSYYGSGYCGSSEHIYIYCNPAIGEIRLTEGNRGILEVYYYGWGFVCDDGWTNLNSNVSCRILGYGSALSTNTSYYYSDVDYKLDYIGCSGNETNILECSYALYSTYSPGYCSSSEHIYITCSPVNGEIRLTNGDSGILEVYYDGWGFVCDDGWSNLNSNVTCRILGYNSALSTATSYYNSYGDFKLNYVTCSGTEIDILECSHTLYSTYGYAYCSSNEHIYITCSSVNGEIRLTEGNSGILEVYYDGWGFVCDDGWTILNSNVSCNILGYGSALSTETSYDDSNVDYKLLNIGCSGYEIDILECYHQLYEAYYYGYCVSSEHIYIDCNPANGEIRLTEGNRGVLEVYYDGWGFICDDGWSGVNADVVCRILGYSSPVSTNTSYYYSDVNYKLNFISCSGTETQLLECSYSTYTPNYCSSSEHIYITCGPANGDIRLTEGDRGILEVYYDGWGFVCDDGWNNLNSNVTCRILGYGSAVSTATSYYDSDVDYKLNYVNCNGTEIDILECSYTLYSTYSSQYCFSYEHIYITCSPVIGEIRLTEGNSGILEVYYDGWGLVCDNGWTNLNSNVSCRILGYSSAASTETSYYDSNVDYKLLNISCSGYEIDILECDHELYEAYNDSYCGSSEHIYIDCNPAIGEIRLTEGNRGILEVYYDGWGFICDDGWTNLNSNVTCRILGYSSPVSTNTSYYDSDVDYKLNFISCSGTETDILECSYSAYTPNYCSSSEHIYIICGPANGDIRLTEGDRGVLEVYYDGWGFVCDDGWSNLNSNVSCSILGYRSALFTRTSYYYSDVNYKLNFISCSGTETDILECSYSTYTPGYCSSYEHIYIVCRPEFCESIAPTAEENSNPLQYYDNSTLYYVCADEFTEANGEVVCRENLGTTFQNHSSVSVNSLNGTYPIYPYSYQCSGYENSLCECNQTANLTCDSDSVAHIQCQTPVNGTVRVNYYTGLLQAYFGIWGYVCDDYFDEAASNTVCRQLGHRGALNYFTGSYHNNYNFEVDNIRCLGNQFSINNCDFQRTHNCYSSEHLSVQCDSGGCESLLPNIDGTSQIAYYFTDRQWNYICGNSMTQQTANVICKENGNTTALAYRSVPLDFGPIRFPILGSRFQCSGSESSLCQCGSVSEICSSMEIVEVQCDLPVNGEVRLSEGHQGILDIYRNGWGFVCGAEWNQAASDIACQNLGFRRAYANSTYAFRNETVDPSLNGALCLGNETSLFECELYKYHLFCPSIFHISITCIADGCESFAPYSHERSVTVEYYDGTQWYYICADDFTNTVADVICIENSYTGHFSYHNVSTTGLANNSFIYPYTFECQDFERSLCNCSKQSSNCTSNSVIAIRCNPPVNGDVRLTGGDQGELQLYQDGWNSVCDFHKYYIYYYHSVREFWAGPESNVACRTLGFRRADTFNFAYLYHSSTNSIYADFRCFGNETSLLQCHNISNSYCVDGINLKCISDGCETFIPYADEYPVVVQFYNLESWYTLSADGFTQEIANMICRENNHAQGAMNFITRNRSSEDYPIFPYKHLCGGVYETLCECPFGENPTGDQIVMIQCHPQVNPPMRLTDGSSGELLVYVGEWGYVCYNNWNQLSSDIACRQLGYLNAISYTTYTSDFDLTYPSIVYFSPCSPSNFDELFNCGYTNSTYYTCGDSYVSLICQTEGCQTYLYNTSDSYQEVRYFTNGQWYYLCSESLTESDADLICQQYGNHGLRSIKSFTLEEATKNLPIYPYSYNCVGNEDSLCECNTTSQTCNSNTILVLECVIPEIGDLRLTDVSNGILEIFYDQRWSYVCDDYFGQTDAEVACRKLGFKKVASYSIGASSNNTVSEPGINNLYCSGLEQSLLDCTYDSASSSDCSSSEHVLLSCETSLCETYPAIYSRTPTPIRVFRDTNWNYLCANGFTQEDAEVVCRENAQSEVISHFATNITQHYYVYPIEEIRYDCAGNEGSLCECPQTPQTCEGDRIVNIQCKLPVNGAVRLNHGHEGLLEFYFNRWGYVCDDYWDILDSNVACRSLGFRRASSFEKYQANPNLTVNFNLDDVHCTGSEASLLECPHKTNHDCYSFEHVYLTCEVDGCEAIAEQSDDSTVVVQYFDGQDWYYLCSENFTMNNGHVICHENFGTRAMSYEFMNISSLTYGYSFYPYQHNCVEDEASLCYCPIQYRNCTSLQAVAIKCQRPEYGTLRLSNVTEGYLEVYLISNWGYICIDYYYYYYGLIYNEEHLADIACRQLGYLKATLFQTEYFDYPPPVPNFVIGECAETETNVTECDYSYLSSYCYYRFLLVCQTEGCEVIPDDIQSLTQVAQTYTDKSWFYLCFEAFTNEEADVYCLETTTTDSIRYLPTELDSLELQRPIYPYIYNCNGTEDSLCSCPTEMEVCDSNNVTSVTCRKPDFGTTRLSDGYFGEIEVYAGMWRIVCQYDYYYYYYRFNQYNADVACRSAGFRAAISYTDIYDEYDFSSTYSSNRYISDISCVGDEESLTDCDYYNDSSCDHKPTVVCDRSGCEAFAGDADKREHVVQYFIGGAWNYICVEEFTNQTGNVICHENGFGDQLSYSGVSANNISINTMIYPSVHNCTGQEDSLCDCPTVVRHCISAMVVALQCHPPVKGATRVSNGTSGYLQVYLDGWRRVCGYYFDHVTANVACKSLGFRSALSTIYEYTDVYVYNGDYFISGINCDGSESNILDCEYYAYYNCYYENGVICEQGGCETHVYDPVVLSTVDHYNDQWYTICADDFNQSEADVVCRELDHGEVSNFTSVLRTSTDYPISPLRYVCVGNEDSLCACDSFQSTCISGNIIQIQCQQPAFGHLRLSNGTSGLLESYTYGWKRVCNYNYYWNQVSSDVVCRYLGYRDALSYSEIYGEYSFSSTGFINNVVCVGNETNIIDCHYDNTSYCYYHNIISCRTEGCQSYISDEHIALEPARYYSDEQWFYLCSTTISMNEANVICRENGFTNGAESINSTLRSKLNPIYEVYPYSIQCDGDESSLCNCFQTSNTCGDQVAVIKCASPDDGTLRYSSYYPNLLEVYYGDTWNFVCASNWDNTDSLVACKQLGYTGVLYSSYSTSSHLNIIYPTGFTEVGCDGIEQSLGQCNHTIGSCSYTYSYYYGGYTSYNEKIVLFCTRGDCEVHAPLTAGDYHLVEYFVDEKRYYICATGFTEENADVVCRETAHTSAVSYRNVSELDLPTYTSIYPLRHNCYGNESSLCNCTVTEEACTSGSVVEVLCGQPENGSIRISSTDGSLEVFIDDWKYVCSYYFNHNDATVACRQLGYSTYDYWYWNNVDADADSEDYLIRDLSCEGTEANLLDCNYTEATICYYKVLVICDPGSCESIIHNATQPTPIRFYDGHSNYYLCESGLTTETANVVCREGSYGPSVSFNGVTQESTGINYAISSNTYSCTGLERSLCDCPYSTNQCENNLVAQVQCEMPEFGQLRIHGEYVLQIYHNSIWRDVCYDRWDIFDSAVACRQLGYRTAEEVDFYYYYYYEFSDYWINNVVCSGNETRLSECRYDLGSYCDYYNPVNLNCISDGCESYAPNAESFPQVVRYYTGGWYYLCAEDFNLLNAHVVCKENEGTTAINYYYVHTDDLTDNLPILQRSFACVGDENSLCDCSSSESTCSSEYVVEIECTPPANGDIRLSNKDSGVLEIYLNEWGYVCDDQWTIEATTVVCRQLGLGDVISYETGVLVNSRVYPYLIDDVQCTGTEEDIFSCGYKTKHNCGSSEHVTILCAPYEEVPIISPLINQTLTLTTFDDFDGQSFTCTAEGTPTPDVYWTQNFDDRIGNSSVLEITSAGLPDTVNIFYCVADNTAGRDVVSVTYNVQIIPAVTSPSSNHSTILTMIAIINIPMTCAAEGVPEPTVYWTTDITETGTSATIVITGAELPEISNTFYCVADNIYGRDVVAVTYVLDITTADVTDSLGALSDEVTNAETISDESAGQIAAVLGNTVNLGISNPDSTTEQNNEILEMAATTTEALVNKTNGTFSNETANTITNVLGTVVNGSLSQTDDTPVAQGSVGSVSPALTIALRTLETFSRRLSEELLATPGTNSRRVVSKAITIIVQVIQLANSDLSLPIQSAEEEYSISLSISLTVARSLSTSDNRLAIATSFIKRSAKPIGESGFSQASDILTTAIVGKNGRIALVEEVSFGFEIISSPGYQSVCVYLEESNWVSNGLTLLETSTESLAVCSSTHFTSFAVFVTPYEAGGSLIERTILSVFSYLLLGISFISLIIALILFLIAGKAFFKVETNIIYFNYCISMLLAIGLFLFGVTSGTFNEIVCKIIAFALHYAWLAVFTWTLCIGILIMYKIVLGVLSTRKIYPYLIVFGWVFPLVIPLITIIITRDYYVDSSKHCFLGYKQGVVWAFIAPVLTIVLINVVLLIIAIAKIIHSKWGNNDNPHKDVIRDALVTAMVLTPVLGVPWFILILNVSIQSTVLEYFFIILNGLIGLVFLLVVVIRNREVQAILKRRKRGDGTGQTPSGALSSSATASSTVSSKFKKTGAEINTLERVKAKEVDIEDAANFNAGFEIKSELQMENIYSNVPDDMEKGATPNVEPVPRPKKERKGFFGTKKSKESKRRSDLEPLEDSPPFYKDVGDISIVSDIKENPVYGIANIGFESSMEMFSNANAEEVVRNPVYGEIPEETPTQSENVYEIN